VEVDARRSRLPATAFEEAAMIGAILLGLLAGTIGRILVPDMWSGLSGPKSWLFSLVLGLAGALLGYLIFTVGLGIGDTDVFDLGGIIGAVIGVIILLPFVGIATRFMGRKAG
jgi:uncharacterized membrane protein YeaQ/YmgE (transglycosylase-associated protein family)